ncbi:transposase [Methanosphaera sp. ISO3-F5]|uniref:transposase n=1 Tax=Methanosphaera sp. ISO3-F5 TaxID=1452353 RepID=UPI002B25F49C|nr:transposase [Methanosphaera sp. ISO3-F5]WQH63350.1 transposase [Methanosphaera sp. ISO3-F5]
MIDENCIYLTQSTLIRGLSKKQFNVLVDISLKLNKLRNNAIKTTKLDKCADDKHFKQLNFKSIITKVKTEFSKDYSLIQAHIANNVIKKHVESFNSYVALTNKSIDNEYKRPSNKPKTRDNRLHNILIPQESITSSKKKLAQGYIELPLSREYKKQLKSKDCRPRIRIPENIRDKKIIQVEIIPLKNGQTFKANFTYKMKKEPLNLDESKMMGIDLGVNNFASIVTSEGTPYIVGGRFLKNQIAFKCKKTAQYQSILNKQGLKTSKRIQKINTKFKAIQNNFLDHTTKFIIETCKKQDIGTIILGYNKNFQYETDMRKKQNQIFTQIAFKKFINKLKTQCQKYDIKLIITEESYTSKSSFLDNDILPTYKTNEEKKEEYKFKGKRIKRGLYKTNTGTLINADINAACNIIRKSKQNFPKERLYKWARTAPEKIKKIQDHFQK